MSENQRCISVSGPFYAKLKTDAQRRGITISSLVERAVAVLVPDMAPSRAKSKPKKGRAR